MHASQRMPVQYHFPISVNTNLTPEDGAEHTDSGRSLFSTSQYERTRIYMLTAEREIVQKKTFTKWANIYLKRSGLEIHDLFVDLRDGKILLRLLEILSHESLPGPTPGRMRIHCLENVDKTLYYLSNMNVHLENVGAHDIVDGNPRITLGLLWTIILRFQIQDISIPAVVDGSLGVPVGERRYSKDALLLWCQVKTADFRGVDIQNFTTSWRDGLAFNALIHKHRPDLIDFDTLSPNTPLQNLESVFLTAEKKLGITRLFDPEDIYVEQPDEKSIITYVSSYYHYFNKLKSETVYLRRATNFISLLCQLDKFTRDYEKRTSDLLEWIFRTIAWLDQREFPPHIEELQKLLGVLKDYRACEKAERFSQKGQLEIDLFLIQTRSRAINLQVYRAPGGLQLAQVNRAWEALEKAEHARETALRDELARQMRLLNLFEKFQRKVKLRETWIQENQKLLQRPERADSFVVIEAALKKHEALETDVCSYADRITAISKMADELNAADFPQRDLVSSLERRVLTLWDDLLRQMQSRFARLELKYKIFQRFSESDYLKSMIQSLLAKLNYDDYGQHYLAVLELLEKHEMFETDIRSIHRSMSHMFKAQELMEHPPGTTLDEEVKRRVIQMNSELKAAYSDLIHKSNSRKEKLLLSKTRFELLADMDEHESFIKDQTDFLKHLCAQRESNAKIVSKRYPAIETELESRRRLLENLFEEASLLCQKQCPEYGILESRVNELRLSWDKLIQVASEVKKTFLFLRDFRVFSSDCDDLGSFLHELLDSDNQTTFKCSRLDKLDDNEPVLMQHESLITNVDSASTSLEQLKIQGDELKDLSETLGVKFIEELLNLDPTLRTHIPDRSSTVNQLVESRLNGLEDLLLEVQGQLKRTHAMLTGKKSIYQLFRMANSACNWVNEKDVYLKQIIIADFECLKDSEKDKENQKSNRLELVRFRFFELESGLSKMAEKVSVINQLSAKLLRNYTSGELGSIVDEESVSRVVNVQNRLNEAWNRLADLMESTRDRLMEGILYADLVDECRCTSEWIADKQMQLQNLDNLDVTDGTDQVRGQVKNLQNDIRAIEARVEDIGVRIGKLVSGKHGSIDLGETHGKPEKAPVDLILIRHRQLTREWMNLKDAVEDRLKRISAAGGTDSLLDRLEKLQAWLEQMRIQILSAECPKFPQETERFLLAQEQLMQELSDREPEVRDLLETGRSAVRERYDAAHLELQQRLNEVEDEWRSIKKAVEDQGTTLKKRYATQYFFSEASLLDVILNQQATFLNKMEIPTSLDAVHDTQRQHETFCNSMATCTKRIRNLLDFGGKLVTGESTNDARVLEKCSSLERKYANNCAKAEELTELITKTSKLYEFYYDAEDLESWIRDKLEEVEVMRKRLSTISYDRIETLEQQIENHREVGDKVILSGQRLSETYPDLDERIKSRLERVHTVWDDLMSVVRDLARSVGEKHRDEQVNDSLKRATIWLNTQEKDLWTFKEGQPRVPDPKALGSLHHLLKEHERRKKQLIDHQTNLNKLREQIKADPSSEPNKQLNASIDQVDSGLQRVDRELTSAQSTLTALKSASQDYVELSLEACWVREKRQQLQVLPQELRLEWTNGQGSVGQALLRVQRLRRQLKSHQLETDNRRPRMKVLCERIENNYIGKESPGQKIDAIDRNIFKKLLEEVRSSWSALDKELDELRHEVEMNETVCQLVFDAIELEAWISEQELYVLSGDKPKDEQAAMNLLRKCQSRMTEQEKWYSQLSALRNRARTVNEQLIKHRNDTRSSSPALRSYEQAIQSSATRVERAFKSLRGLTAEKRAECDTSVSKFRVLHAISDLETWISEKALVAGSHELGNDIDHCCALRQRFLNFIKVTVPDGAARVSAVNDHCVRLIARGHPEAAEVALGKDAINEAWADLLELIETRKQLLNAAWDMHHFVGDCQDIEERINSRLNNLPPAPTTELITGKKTGLAVNQRSHASLEQELHGIELQINRLASTARQLFARYAGSQAEQLQARHVRVQQTWHQLRALTENRMAILNDATRIHKFLVTARELILWLELAKDQMETKERPRDVHGVEALINEHIQLKHNIEAYSSSISDCLNIGRSLMQSIDTGHETLTSNIMTGPIAEVRERCVQLATGHLLVQELWRERWDRLHLLLEVRQFARDANGAETWLATKEIQLDVARRQLGETLAETLSLLGAHDAFQKTLAGAEERFMALRRLTTLEIRAMEWKPDEAQLREQEKREKIREVVKEFLPQYVKSQAVLTSNHRTRSHPVPRPDLRTRTYTRPTILPIDRSIENARKTTEAIETAPVPNSSIPQKLTPSKTVIHPAREDVITKADVIPPMQHTYTRPTEKKQIAQAQMTLKPQTDKGADVRGHVIGRVELPVPAQREQPQKLEASVEFSTQQHRKMSTPRFSLTPASQEHSVKMSDSRQTTIQKATPSMSTPGERTGSASKRSSSRRESVVIKSSPESEQSKSSNSDGSNPNVASRRRTSRASTSRIDERAQGSTDPQISQLGTPLEPASSRTSKTAEIEQFMHSMPRLEGPVVRKRDLDEGGVTRSKSAGRSWLPIYMVLDSGLLYAFKDYRSRKAKPMETLRGEPPLDLTSAQAAIAADYTKRPCVFRLRLADGREFLFQTANDRVVQRWIDAINEAARRMTELQAQHSPEQSEPLGRLSRQHRTGSMRFESSGPKQSMKRFFSLRRKN